MLLHFIDGSDDKNGLIHGNVDLHAGRQCLIDPFHFFLDPRSDGHRIGSRLFLDSDSHGRDAVKTRQRSFFLRTVFRSADIFYFHRRAFVITDDQIVKVRNAGKLAFDPDGIFLGLCLDPAARQFDIFTFQGDNDVGGRNFVRPHFCGIQPDAHLSEPQPVKSHVTDLIDPLQLFLQYFIDVGGKIAY
ncbi:MAG: hypothetical protein BWX55_00316 [Deltaproteobacteria bacterium ADurb.Bin022]|nr:MAG: hypothetical protein BWX55_00316 [Deltaproteobacteria bacterium ADurb.Bin022]